MEIVKPNDILVASINNPEATTYDLMKLDLNSNNTSLFAKEDYMNSDFIKEAFKTSNGEFDEQAFNESYNRAAFHYKSMGDEQYLEDLNTLQYSPFDTSRPMDAKTFKVEVEYSKDYNPFQQTYSRSGINSIDENDLSIRELAQKTNIMDFETGEWFNESVNDRSLLGKFFGATLVYAQWDQDGMHSDQNTGRQVKHSKGDWKINEFGNLYIETLGDREMYGKQILNPMDSLTTDGSFANKFDFFDNDNRESSAVKATIKLAAEIAPLLIPGFNVYYAGVKAAVGMASVLPTFYKSFEGMLLGDLPENVGSRATLAENYMAKFNQRSTSDEAQGSMFNYEQVAQMTSDIFSQIFEQRAASKLALLLTKSKTAALTAKQAELTKQIQMKIGKGLATGQIPMDKKAIKAIAAAAMAKMPELQSLQKMQSSMSKSLALGYMALTSTADVYGEALQSGYDRRTAGFASLAAASGTYGLMMNNRMGDWFLDQTTGYTTGVNKALVNKAVKQHFANIQTDLKKFAVNSTEGKRSLAKSFRNIKTSMGDLFTNHLVVGEAMMKNAVIEGIEEMSEELVIDATKGMVDIMSYLGLTKSKGSFNTIDNVFSAQGAERYLASLLGGILGGGMFELHRTKIEPFLDPKNAVVLSQDTRRSVHELVANGHTDLLLKEIEKHAKKLGNNTIAPPATEGAVPVTSEKGESQADIIATSAAAVVRTIHHLMNKEGSIITDDEIIERAMLDHMIVADLKKSRTEGQKLGVEAMIVHDFRQTSQDLLDLNLEIKRLEAEEKDSITLTESKGRAKELQKKLEDIKEGKFSEEYYGQAIWYLSKQISDPWIQIDLESYTKHKYQRDFYSLPKTGLGITQETVKKKWDSYIEAKDVRHDLEVAYNAYKEQEQNINKSIANYEKKYSIERKKTIPNLLDLQKTLNIFDTFNPEKKQQHLAAFIETAKEYKKHTGENLLPWDVYKTKLVDLIFENDLIRVIGKDGKLIEPKSYFNKKEGEKDDAGKDITKLDTITRLLTDLASNLPQTDMSLEHFASYANSFIQTYNEDILATIEKLSKSEIEGKSEKIEQLEKNLVPIKLLDFEEHSKKRQQEKFELTKNLLEKADKLGLEPRDIIIAQIINDLKNPVEKFSDIVSNAIKKLNAPGLNYQQYLKALLKSNLYLVYRQEQILLAQVEAEKAGVKVKDGDVPIFIKNIENGNVQIEDLKKIFSEYSIYIESIQEKITTYTEEEKKLLEDFSQAPEIFEANNYVLDAIIKEIKKGNLDKELIIQLESMLKKYTTIISKKYFSELSYNSSEIYNIIDNLDEITGLMQDALAWWQIQMDEPGVKVPDYIPDYLRLKTMEDLTKFNNAIIDLNSKSKENSFDKIKQIVEIVKDSDKFVSNDIYEYLQNFMISLGGAKNKVHKSVIEVLKREELSLFRASDITNYLSEGIRLSDMDETINALDLLKTVIFAMQTTEISMEDVYGFIQSRKDFAKNNKITSEITKLSTVSSDIAQMMINDLDRLRVKLNFLKELSKSNLSKNYNEQELIRTNLSGIMIESWKELLTKGVVFKGKPVIPDLEDILESKDSVEKQLLNIEAKFFETHKDLDIQEQKDLMDLIADNYNFKFHLDSLGTIDKEAKTIADFDYILNIATSLSLYSKDINNKFRTILQNVNFDKAPFYTQELAIKVAYASIINPELFAHLVNKYNHKNTHITDYITYVLGTAGTGKTSVVIKSLILLLEDNNPNLNMWFVAPHTKQSEFLEKVTLDKIKSEGFTSNGYNKDGLFEQLGLVEHIETLRKITEIEEDTDKFKTNFADISFGEINQNLPNIIFIDEVTHFDALELELLNTYVKYVNNQGKDLRIVTTGDVNQRGKYLTIDERKVSYNVERTSGIYTPILNLSVRSANVQNRANNDMLVKLVSEARKVYTGEEDIDKVLKIIEGNLVFRAYVAEDTITGTYLTSKENFNSTTLQPIANGMNKHKERTLGILVDETTRKNVEAFIKELGIDESRVYYYSVDNIQGSEEDYMIFNTGIIESEVITHTLRDLYTFMSRSKIGTVVIEDKDLQFIELSNELDKDTDYIEPLTDVEIAKTKVLREKALTDLLNPNFKVLYDSFAFKGQETKIKDDIAFYDNLNTTADVEQGEVDESTIEKEVLEKVKREDNKTHVYYSFYNDLNVDFEIDGDEVHLNRNNLDFSYGLDILFDKEQTGITLDKQQFVEITESLISLKYDIIKNIADGKKFLLPESNSFIFDNLWDTYTPSKVKTEIVLKKSTYKENFNKPYSKQLDNIDKHWNGKDSSNGTTFPNLYLKLSYEGRTHYIHLVTGSTQKEVARIFGPNSATNKQYIRYLGSLEEQNELVVDPKNISFYTSTYIIKPEEKVESKKEKFTINDLADKTKFPGLKFYNLSTGEIVDKYAYNLFPTTFVEFKKLYSKVTYGEAISDEKLKEMFYGKSNKTGRRGKPYIAVSYLNTIGGKRSQVKILMLKSKTKKYSDLKPDPFKAEAGINDNMFNGNQVLDLLISLALQKPKLFNELFRKGFFSEKSELLSKVFKSINDDLKPDLIAHLTYEKTDEDPSYIRTVLEDIKKLIDNGKTSQTEIKKEILKNIGNRKRWFMRFWNFVSYPDHLRNFLEKAENILPEAKERYGELLGLLKDVNTFWADEQIYYNVKIKSSKGAGASYEIDRIDSDLDNLYTTVVPEGPRMLLEFGKVLDNNITETTDNEDSLKEKEKRRKEQKKRLERLKKQQDEEKKKDVIPNIVSYFEDWHGEDYMQERLEGLVNAVKNKNTDQEVAQIIDNNWSKLYAFLEQTFIINDNEVLLIKDLDELEFLEYRDIINTFLPVEGQFTQEDIDDGLDAKNWINGRIIPILLGNNDSDIENILELCQ